jgi:hypothetical protein
MNEVYLSLFKPDEKGGISYVPVLDIASYITPFSFKNNYLIDKDEVGEFWFPKG